MKGGEFVMHARVALIGENSVEFVTRLINIWNDGDCAVLIDWRTPFKRIVELMGQVGVHKCHIEKKILDNQFSQLCDIEMITYERQTNAAQILPDLLYDKFKSNYSKEERL